MSRKTFRVTAVKHTPLFDDFRIRKKREIIRCDGEIRPQDGTKAGYGLRHGRTEKWKITTHDHTITTDTLSKY